MSNFFQKFFSRSSAQGSSKPVVKPTVTMPSYVETGLERFTIAQQNDYFLALNEIRAGHKSAHWIWFVFPQVQGLGHSMMCQRYGINSREEAMEYLAHPVLGTRLREISEALLVHSSRLSAQQILGTTDAMKVRSCMTLFDAISPNDVFSKVLHEFYDDKRCPFTLKFLS